jgi:Icc-related predicted phosphoesterase
MRLAAVGDLHFTEGLSGTLRPHFDRLHEEADVMLLAGDLTNMGRPSEMEALLDELAEVRVPIVAVLGNHDHQSDSGQILAALLQDRGVHLLDGGRVEMQLDGRTVGVAGVKGFCGGFAPHVINAFGERELKAFIAEGAHEAKKLEAALSDMGADVRVALLHYAPITETLGEEPLELHAFLGSSLLMRAIEAGRVDVVFHGHAHLGRHEGRSPSGVRVYNVAMPVMRRPYCVVTI